MSRLRTAATSISATLGVVLTAALFLASHASARYAPEPPADNSAAPLTPPPSVSASSTSLWWFVLVALVSVAATLLVLGAVQIARGGWRRPDWIRHLA
jgi:hypothetical protein